MRDDMKRWLQRHTLQGQRGGVLLEALIAVTLLSSVLTMAVQSSATGSRAVSTVHELNTAQNIARSQLEYALNEAYCAPPCSYTSIAVPTGFSVTAEAEVFPGGDANIEYVQVTVSSAVTAEELIQIQGVKANR
ncbi:MAG: hypothetical protein O2812_01380 [Chloroflexi bacterium]|nr:hypothetical protein [Chloroflexota bacterium]